MEPFIIDVSELEYNEQNNIFKIETEKGKYIYNLFMQGKPVYVYSLFDDDVDYHQIVNVSIDPDAYYLSDGSYDYRIVFEKE